MINFKSMLAQAISHGVSDVHVNVTMPPIVRINTELVEMDLPAMTEQDVEQMVPIQNERIEYQLNPPFFEQVHKV